MRSCRINPWFVDVITGHAMTATKPPLQRHPTGGWRHAYLARTAGSETKAEILSLSHRAQVPIRRDPAPLTLPEARPNLVPFGTGILFIGILMGILMLRTTLAGQAL